MHILTPQLLANFSVSRRVDPGTILRGRGYFNEGRVKNIEVSENNSRAICEVLGDTNDYAVEIEVDQRLGELLFDCDCPYAENNFCKHMVAAALALSVYLKEEGDVEADEEEVSVPHRLPTSKNWRTKLNDTLALIPRRAASSNASRYVALVVLARNEYGYYNSGYYNSRYAAPAYSYALEPFIIKANSWFPLLQGSTLASPQAITAFLESNKKWIAVGEKPHQPLNPAGCLNLNSDAVSFLGILQNVARIYGAISGISIYLAMLAKLDIPVFLGSLYPAKIDRRVQLLSEPVNIKIDLRREASKLILQAGFEHEGSFTLIDKKIETVAENPTWLMLDDRVAQIRNTQALPILSSFPIEIPADQIDVFREQYFAQIAQALPIKGDLIHWQDVNVDPIPRLYLHEDKDNVLRADLRLGYGEHELALTKSEESVAVKTLPESWDLIRVHRQPEREQSYYQLLTDSTYMLKRANATQPYGTFELRARAHPFDFLMHAIPQLTQAGFEIYGEENLKLGKINRTSPTLRVSITSGIDWFDIKTIVEFGDQHTSLQSLRKAMKRGEHYIKLADGSVGQIPEDWLEKYKHLWNLAEETEDGFRVSDLHLPLLDSMLEANDALQIPADLLKRRNRLRAFEKITSQPLPAGFVGELRPYQKHGFDWLHFLKHYKFGGILADDMGLGKTIQVLAYLQSLKEQSTDRNVTLLVVPKSLIVNWQRESEKFTPALRFLEYLGNIRNKDTSMFNDYDVVLTTYGTMLRDVELLHTYQFGHIILDESQAIKNPLAKSAKAARLLKADHRLVMTGTPVENNTFELWSQFAFLNPGLLGNMDYFRREFANPIESGGDEKAATLLRSLVYPFILRRTKEQVAPELPLRTERIIYIDMDAAQKKIYAQTRERYRAELLGLIETEGMNDARFKILEGLLRLRQIAIHPALVEKSYRGAAPKFEVLIETLETLQAENHKALIFSQFVETLKLVKHELDVRQIKYVYLDGKTTHRQAHVDVFQNDPSYPFFLISLRAGGVGLNLTAADYVIHLDPWWNPAVEMQASDRAHRIGQDKPVFIYKIITRDTVEEKILQLQEKKRALVKSIIASEASFFKSLTKDDVKSLFE
jgi:non-specific serine/threonine protein kinase